MHKIKNLGITFPSGKSVVKNTAIIFLVMLVSGTCFFFMDTISMYLFAIS